MLYSLIRNILFLLEAETAHHLSLNLLKYSYHFYPRIKKTLTYQPTILMGLKLANPIGLAAGLDKNGEYIDALASFGFGYIEIGTVTPRPQPGNPKPRLFRAIKDEAIVNRMGFNNRGCAYVIEQIKKSKYKGVIGINIGKNADTPIERAVDDYIYGLQQFYPYASYITINISSPNTKNLRDLQSKEKIYELLSAIKDEQQKLVQQYHKYVPLAVKIAPDLDDQQVIDIAEVLLALEIDGVICTNTSIDKSGLQNSALIDTAGGLSGKPIFARSNRVLSLMNDALQQKIPIIGVGGISSGKDAIEKLQLGATALQLYTGFIYQGPELVSNCLKSCNNRTLNK